MLTGSLNVLGTLENLVSLDVSYNNLFDYLPDTAFFQELPVTSLSGNRDLCTRGEECYLQTANAKSNKNLHERNLARSIVVSIILCIALAAVITVSGMKLARQAQSRAVKREEESSGQWEIQLFQKISFSKNDMIMKLSDLSVIGQGCSEVIYKVETGTGQQVAVKKLWPARTGEALEIRDSFAAEVNTLGSIRHKNIVRLLGCCTNRKMRLLVFDFISNGSLFQLLHEKKLFMDWQTRFKIILGAQQGIAYLHHDCILPVIHRDIKANNILIGPQFDAYLAGFGLAEHIDPLGQPEKPCNVVAGSYGCIAPECRYSMKITEKSAVYSYGVVLLKVRTGKQPNDGRIAKGAHIVNWVEGELQRKAGVHLIDERLKGWPDSETQKMVQVLGVALLCVSRFPQERPTMQGNRSPVQQLLQTIRASHYDLIIG